MNKLCEAIGQYGVQCSETKELAPPEYLLTALKEYEARVRDNAIKIVRRFQIDWQMRDKETEDEPTK